MELFARQSPPGWDVWGNEVESTLPDFWTKCPEAVSYTHLDVYKRQLLEGYGSDNPGSKSQGMKQLMAGGGIILRCV